MLSSSPEYVEMTRHFVLKLTYVYLKIIIMTIVTGNLAVCIGLAMVLYLCFEVPLAHAEKILFGLMGIGRMPSASKRNVSVKK